MILLAKLIEEAIEHRLVLMYPIDEVCAEVPYDLFFCEAELDIEGSAQTIIGSSILIEITKRRKLALVICLKITAPSGEPYIRRVRDGRPLKVDLEVSLDVGKRALWDIVRWLRPHRFNVRTIT